MLLPYHSIAKGWHYVSMFAVTYSTIYKCQKDNVIVMDSAYPALLGVLGSTKIITCGQN